MEHILQFGISIDDDMIKTKVEDAAIKSLANDIKKNIFELDWSGNIRGFRSVLKEVVTDVMDGYKDKIIEEAAKSVAESIKRSKKYKEAVLKITEEVAND